MSVLIVDDHPLVREGTRHILEASDDIRVVGEAGDANGALDAARARPPDVAVVDFRLPGVNGVELTRALVGEHPATKVLVLSAFGDAEYLRAARRAGATGYLVKSTPGMALIEAILRVHRGEVVIGDGVELPDRSPEPGAPSLTDREAEILGLLAEGLPNKAIATRLAISRRTVEGHVSRIFAKVGTASRTELFRWAVEHRVIILDSDDRVTGTE